MGMVTRLLVATAPLVEVGSQEEEVVEVMGMVAEVSGPVVGVT